MTPDVDPADVRRAQVVARHYRKLGYNPLPSRMDRKGPALDSFAEFWEEPIPDVVFDGWASTNIQIMCGARWKLCVVDCDGDRAHDVWREIKNDCGFEGPLPTWVARSGGGGWHYYFTPPAWLDEVPGRRLWGVWDTHGGPKHKGDWLKHQEVRLLGDRQLVIAPPSLHVKSGDRYHFLPGRSPKEYPIPMPAPEWLLRLPAIVSPTVIEARPSPAVRPRARGPMSPTAGSPARNDVIAAIPDKAALVRSWGLRLARDRPNRSGWIAAHAIDRDDEYPSASFHPESGVYMDCRDGTKLSLFDLAVAMGRHADWRHACLDLGDEYLPKNFSRIPTTTAKHTLGSSS